MEKRSGNSKFVFSALIFFTVIFLFAFVFLSLRVDAAANEGSNSAPSSTTYSWLGKLEYSGSASQCSVTVPLYYKTKPGRLKETLVAPVIAFDSKALSYSAFEFESLNPPLVNHENSYISSEGKKFDVDSYLTLRIARKDKTLKDDSEHVIPSTKLGTLSFSVKDTSVSSPLRLYFVSTSYNKNRKTAVLVDNTAHKKKELEVTVLSNCGQQAATPTPAPSPVSTLMPVPTSSPTPSPSPSLTPVLTPSPAPSLTPTPAPSPIPSPTPSPTPVPSPTKTPKPTPVPPICTETDGGMDFYVKGTLTLSYGNRSYSYSDSCSSNGKSVTESFCTGSGRGGALALCKYGCQDGACKSS